MKRALVTTASFVAVLIFAGQLSAQGSIGWSLTGGKPWANRVGPGMMLALGGNTCTDDYCDDALDVRLLGSFGTTLGFFYRIVPNLVMFVDLHVAYMNTDYTTILKDDRGLLFQLTGGAEFHAPFTGWFEAYVGLGFGYALLRAKGTTRSGDLERVESLRGVNIELKIGADVYPFSRIPTLGLGPLLRIGFAIWPKACAKEDGDRVCAAPEVLAENDDLSHIDETPFLVFLGIVAKYGF